MLQPVCSPRGRLAGLPADPFTHPMLVRIRWLILAVLVCGVAGCRHSEPGASPSGNSPAQKVLRIGNGTEPEELDPQVATGIPEREIMTSIFEGLVDEDPKDLHPVPAVAQSWDISQDQRTYTFHLRPGLVWSNGRPLTSNDFILTFKRLLNPTFAATNAYLVFNVVQGAKDYYDHKTTTKNGKKMTGEKTSTASLYKKTWSQAMHCSTPRGSLYRKQKCDDVPTTPPSTNPMHIASNKT